MADADAWPRAAEIVGACREPGLELDEPSFVDTPARGVEGGLRIVAVVDEATDDLEMALWLHRPTHDAERAEQGAALEQHARDDRVERPLRGRERVRVPGVGAEARRPVLQDDAGARRDDARAEAVVEALDQRHRRAAAVDRAQIRRAAAGQRGARVEWRRPGARAPDGRPDAPRRKVARQRAVMHGGARVVERELHRLDLRVQTRLETVVEREREQRRGALAVRRQLADLDTAVAVAAAARPTPSGARPGRPLRASIDDAIAAATWPS